MKRRRHYLSALLAIFVCSSFDQYLPLIEVPRAFMAPAFSATCAQLGEGGVRQREFGRCQILMQVGDRRGARDQKNIGRAMEQPAKRHLHWSRAEPCCDL